MCSLKGFFIITSIQHLELNTGNKVVTLLYFFALKNYHVNFVYIYILVLHCFGLMCLPQTRKHDKVIDRFLKHFLVWVEEGKHCFTLYLVV